MIIKTVPETPGQINDNLSNVLKRDSFLYLEPKTSAQQKDFAQCGPCRMFVPSKYLDGKLEGSRCIIHGSLTKVEADDSCGYMLPWAHPDEPNEEVIKDHAGELLKMIPGSVTPDESGLVSRRVQCHRCKYQKQEATVCGLYENLNKQLPEMFDLDTKITPHSCCNAQDPAEAELSKGEKSSKTTILPVKNLTKNLKKADSPKSSVFIAFDGDAIGRRVGDARLRDDVEEIRRVSQAIDRGNAVFTSWVQANGGSVVESGGDEGLIEVPAASLSDLPRLREAYKAVVEASVSVGVGKTVSEASKALLVAKLRGRDKILFFDPDMQKEIQEAVDHPKSESEKLHDEYLGKAEDQGSAADLSRKGAMVSHMDRPAPAASVQGEHSEGAVAQAAAAPPAAPGEKSPALQGFRAHAAQADQADRAKAVQDSAGWQRLKLGVADALGKLRTQLPQLAQIKQAAPETYAAVTALANSVVEMARGIQQQEQTLQKAQGGPKLYRERTQGFGKPVEIPGREHPTRAGYDQNYLSAIAAHYTKGDVKALKPLRVPVASLSGGNSAGAVNKDRLALYQKILSAGDEVPPVVVRRSGEGYELLDGTHRAAAAKATGTEDLPAVEIPVRKDEPGLSTVQTPNPVLKPLDEMALSELSQEELDPSKTVPHGPDLAKEAMRAAPYKHLHLPVGSELHGKVKVNQGDKTAWRSVRAGQIQSTTPNEPPTMGANGHPVSSRSPSST